MGLEVVVLLLSGRLRVSPVARDDVLVRVDQLTAVRHRGSVHEVFRHDEAVPVCAGDQSQRGTAPRRITETLQGRGVIIPNPVTCDLSKEQP